MIIKRVTIEKLFGFLDYDLVFPEGRKVIITGPNGFGKTMILNIIFAYMKNDIEKLMSLPFGSVDIYTDSKCERFVRNENCVNKLTAKDTMFDDLTPSNVIMIDSDRSSNIDVLDSKISRQRELLTSILNESMFRQAKVVASVNAIFSIAHRENKKGMIKLPPMINERLIGLVNVLKDCNKYGFFGELKWVVDDNSSEYYFNELDVVVLKNLINEFFVRYESVGDVIKRVRTFIDIVNDFEFAFKNMVPCRYNGFAMKNIFNEDVEMTKLSSGEKNIISIMFDLIFKTENGAIILIDEPEISLHVSWQRDLICRFNKISSCSDYNQLIIATHSPEIINDDWKSSIDLYTNHRVCE
ncbi:MAG: AAA family ATPase [Plesiomonas shigelloides]